MKKPLLGSGACWLLSQVASWDDNSTTAVITQAGTRGINLFSTLHKADADDSDTQTYSSTMEVMAYLYLTYDTGIEVTLNFSLYTMIEDTAPLTSILTMMRALQKNTFWVTMDSLQNLPNTNQKQVSVYLKTAEQLVEAQATDLEVEESSGYDTKHTGTVMLRQHELALLSKRYEQVLSEPEKHPFLTSDVAAALQQIKDEAFDDLKSNIQQD